MKNLNNFRQYINCARWASGFEADCIFDPKSIIALKGEYKEVMNSLDIDLREGYPGTSSDFAHDLWLTRNGHGAGFWDRGHGEVGDLLTEWVKAWGTIDLYQGADGYIYQTGA